MYSMNEFVKESLAASEELRMCRFSKREQNFQACLNVLPNSAEFSAKILQDLYSCNEIKLELLAKVLITGGNTLMAHVRAQAHSEFFVKTSVEVSIH